MEAFVAMPRCLCSAENGYDDLEPGNGIGKNVTLSKKLRLAMAAKSRPVAVRTWPPGCGPKKIPIPVQKLKDVIIVDNSDSSNSTKNSLLDCSCRDDPAESSSGYQGCCCKDSGNGMIDSVSLRQEKSLDHPADRREIILIHDDDDNGSGAENLPDESIDIVKSPSTPQTLRDYKSWPQHEDSNAGMPDDPSLIKHDDNHKDYSGVVTAEKNNLTTQKDLGFQDHSTADSMLGVDGDLEEGEISAEVCEEVDKEGATNVAGNGAADMDKDDTEDLMAEDSQHLEQLKAMNALKHRLSVPSFLAQFEPSIKRPRTKVDPNEQRILWRFNHSQQPENRDSPNRSRHGNPPEQNFSSKSSSVPSLRKLPESCDGSSATFRKPNSPLTQRLSALRDWPDDESPPFVSESRKARASAVVEPLSPSCNDNSDEEDLGSYNEEEEDDADVDDVNSSDESRTLVMKTLKIYEKLRRKYQQQDEAKHGKVKRADMRAGTDMKSKDMWINRKARIGPVPGVVVGDQFYYRSEIHIIGLHQQTQSGISCLNEKDSKYGVKVAVSVVASGGYEDDKDTGDVLIYTGQGGNDYSSGRRQNSDQELHRGNLAMKNSYTHQLPIRVIRGYSDKKSPSARIYSYDGLYKIKRYWLENGAAGFKVYQFELVRLPGQPELGSRLTVFAGKLKSQLSTRQNLVKNDLSEGKELVPIRVVNTYGKDLPDRFKYVSNMVLSRTILLGGKPPKLKGCRCKGRCWDPAICGCIKKNGGNLPYTHDGVLVETKSIVYECGPDCGCSESCYNRVSQKGGKFNLEVFKTKEKGWGVRSWDTIPAGSFICEYVGELLDSREAEKRVGRDVYLFDIDCIKGNQDRGVDISCFFEDQNLSISNSYEEFHDAHMSIDAATCGNVARFINHSCSPNIFVQCVFWDHEDLRRPHLMMFAMDNIRPFTEFSYDYNYTIGSVRYPDGREKIKLCYCGAQNCRGRLY